MPFEKAKELVREDFVENVLDLVQWTTEPRASMTRIRFQLRK